MDIDETLIHCTEYSKGDIDYSYRLVQDSIIRDGQLNNYFFYPQYDCIVRLRPHLKRFLDFCQYRFKYCVIWSAGKEEFVHKVVEDITSIQFDMILTRKDTEFDPDTKLSRKDLHKVYNAIPECSSLNTILLDDRTTNFHYNPHNGTTIPAFKLDPMLYIQTIRFITYFSRLHTVIYSWRC